MSDLAGFLSPQSIAVIGASEGVEKIGGRIIGNLIRHNYQGRLYPINLNRREIWGLPAYRDLATVPGPIDLALVSIPAAGVLEAIDACAAAGITRVVIASSGFADAGEEGAALQARVVARAQRAGIRIAGPNTQGFYNVPLGIAATFSPAINLDPGPKDKRPRIGVVSQSGGLGFSLFNRGRQDGLDFSSIVSIGNQGDLELVDYADILLDDDDTHVVMLFIEAIKTPAKFIALAEKAASLEKPIVVAKVGRNTAARRAVATHTGSLAGSDAAYDAMFERYGVIRAESAEEMLEIATLLIGGKLPRGNRIAIISATGGTAAWLTDTCEAHGLELPEIDPDRRRRLMEFIPPYGSPTNPVDITAQGLRGYAQALEVVVDSPNHDSILIAISLAQEARITREGAAIAALVHASDKPILIYTYATPLEKAKQLMAGWNLHYFARMEGCALALKAALAYRRFQERRRTTMPGVPPSPESAAARTKLAERGKVLCEWEAAEILGLYGMATPDGRLARCADEAVAAAAELGWPVALKVQSPHLPHKTEAKAVALDIGDETALRRAYDGVIANARTYAPAATILGVLVQKMARPGVELIAGIVTDPAFGPVVMCGLGGIHAELFADVAFALAPLDEAQAEAMVDRLKAPKIIAGLRGAPPSDRRAIIALLVHLSCLAAELGDRIVEIDLNPIIVHQDGQGLSLVDALIVQKDKTS